MKRLFTILLLAVFAAPLCSRASDMLNWDAERDRVEAQIENWSVSQVLQRVAAVTGWQVLIDPSIKEVVPTKFKGKNSGDALQRLLGKINYALAPETNGASRLFVYRTSRNEATQPIAPTVASGTSTNKGRIENELIVTLKPGEKIEDLAKRLGAKVVGKIDGMNAYRLRFDTANATESARSDLQNDPSVAQADDNFSIGAPEGSIPLGGGERPLGLVPKALPDGDYIIVGLIDTAVQGKEGGINSFLLPGISAAGEASGATKDLTHGTAMAETILRGISLSTTDPNTGVRILPVDVYGGNPATSTFDVANGIYKAVNNGANYINLSLGSEGDSPFLRNTIDAAAKQNVRFFAAAGNEPTTALTYPAAYSSVTAVTALDRSGNIAPYANRGSFVDTAAPGTSIVNFNGQSYVVTGTSAATAYVTGKAVAQADAARAKK